MTLELRMQVGGNNFAVTIRGTTKVLTIPLSEELTQKIMGMCVEEGIALQEGLLREES